MYIFRDDQKKQIPLQFCYLFEKQKIVSIANLIDRDNITGIEILQGVKATVLYGSVSGGCGVIILKTNNDELLKKMETIVRTEKHQK